MFKWRVKFWGLTGWKKLSLHSSPHSSSDWGVTCSTLRYSEARLRKMAAISDHTYIWMFSLLQIKPKQQLPPAVFLCCRSVVLSRTLPSPGAASPRRALPPWQRTVSPVMSHSWLAPWWMVVLVGALLSWRCAAGTARLLRPGFSPCAGAPPAAISVLLFVFAPRISLPQATVNCVLLSSQQKEYIYVFLITPPASVDLIANGASCHTSLEFY